MQTFLHSSKRRRSRPPDTCSFVTGLDLCVSLPQISAVSRTQPLSTATHREWPSRPEGDLKMTSPSSRSALITGASGGIGKAVARRLAQDGFNLVVHYAGNSAKAEELVAEINQSGVKAIAIKADVAIAAEVESLFKRSLDEFGQINAVIHTAGIMP